MRAIAGSQLSRIAAASRGIFVLAGVALFTQAAIAEGSSVDSAALLDK